jgi:DNA polymerase-3 subunit delta'
VFILIGTSIDQQISTIRSRCQVVRFAPLSEPIVRELLTGQGITEGERLDRLVRLSGGSPGQALALADDALWECRRTLLAGLADKKPDSVVLARGLIDFAEDAGKDSALQRRRLALVFRLLIEALREILAIRLGAPVRTGAADEQAMLEALAARASSETILTCVERCLDAQSQLDRYIPIALVVEGLIDSLVHGPSNC